MPQFDGVIAFLDNRSFGSIWFWLVLVGMWSTAGRNVIGIPSEVLARARHAQRAGQPESQPVLTLLDWLSLSLPRWHVAPREGAVFLGICAFVLTSLAVLGFGYDLEMAQALVLLLLPFLILFLMRLRLARRLIPLLQDGQAGLQPVGQVGAEAVRRLVWHRRFVTLLSVLAVAIAAFWGMIHALMHPNGL